MHKFTIQIIACAIVCSIEVGGFIFAQHHYEEVAAQNEAAISAYAAQQNEFDAHSPRLR